MDAFLCVFVSEFLTFFNIVSIRNLFHNCFLVKQNSSNQFPRWRHPSLCCLFSLCMYFPVFFHQFFCPFSRSSPSIFRPINTSDTFPRWRHRYICCLFSYCTHFCAFFLQIFAFFPLSLIDFHTKFFFLFKVLSITFLC